MNNYKKLVKNSGIFAIASLGSKLLSIVLVPFYTYVLNAEQYGNIDMFTTTISLLLPIITLNIFDATLRFSIKSRYSHESIFTSSIIVILFGNLLFFCLYPIFSKISIIDEYIYLFYIVCLLQGFNSTLAQFIRGIENVKSFAFNGVLNTLITLTLNIILLVWYSMGVRGYFISIMVANFVCNIYLIVSGRLWRYFSIKSYSNNLVRVMIKYSSPLIPNSLMWWIMNASDRYIINLFLGMSANGLYAVANKIPTLLNLLNSIFSQAWQLSAIEEGDSKDKSTFYTNIFNAFSSIMLFAVSGILVVLKPTLEIILSTEYKSSWRYVPFLLLAVVFASFSTFLGTNYVAMNNTNGVFKTTLLGAVTNTILNFILIPLIGLNGAAIATMVSYFVVWIIRIYDTRKFVEIKINVKKIVLTILIIFIQIFILFINIKFEIFIQASLLSLILFVNIKDIKDMINKIKKSILVRK